MFLTRILGIDPGIARMGYGVVEVVGGRLQALCFGCIETPPDRTDAQRLYQIFEELQQPIKAYHPTVMAVEQLFFNRNTTTAFTVGQARGVALLCAAQAHVEVAEYTPMQVKLAVTGYGKADKTQVQEMVKLLLSLRSRPRPDDTADALAVAITHAHSAAAIVAARGVLAESSNTDTERADHGRIVTPLGARPGTTRRGPL